MVLWAVVHGDSIFEVNPGQPSKINTSDLNGDLADAGFDSVAALGSTAVRPLFLLWTRPAAARAKTIFLLGQRTFLSKGSRLPASDMALQLEPTVSPVFLKTELCTGNSAVGITVFSIIFLKGNNTKKG